jgi:hypothetical protein
MEAKQVKDLMEAYASVYSQSEEVIEEDLQGAVKAGLEKGAEFMKKNPVGRAVGAVLKPVGKGRGTVTKAEQEAKVKSNVKEESDLFDYLLEYLVAEGYADTNDAAIAIMANMSEGWKQSIVEAEGDVNPSVDGKPMMVGGKPISLNKKEFQWTQNMSKLKKEDPKKYKEVQSLMSPHGWKKAPAGMKVPSWL